MPAIHLGTLLLKLEVEPGLLFRLSHPFLPGETLEVSAPEFEVAGSRRSDFVFENITAENPLPRGGRELRLAYSTAASPVLALEVTLRAYPTSPILRLRYELRAAHAVPLTRNHGQESLTYLSLSAPLLAKARLADIQLSHFDPVAHTYKPNIESHSPGELSDGLSFVGPIALFHTGSATLLAAYEHGADHPQSFFKFHFDSSHGAPGLALAAHKGNIYHGQEIGPEKPFRSAWFELGLAPEPLEGFLRHYRTFFLEEISQNTESRRPYIFYNTWNYQERNRYFNHRPYLETMNYERIHAEIEAAHRLGVDVFVIDTGWFIKTGDWVVNPVRFPDDLQDIRRQLEGYGMKLGLWFNPTTAALTSRVFRTHPEYQMTWQGKPTWQGPVWETEESTGVCLASDYANDFIETLVRLRQELGVTYFKWDGVGQYGCDSPLHHHGTSANSPEERADCYAYQMGLQMIHIVEEVARRAPDIIVDFDITEGGRFVGLGFLSAGKYFLINNGPYFSDFDIPSSVQMEPNTINVFFYPGPARPRICRQGYLYDSIIPSVLFLTHYLPDSPRLSQRNSLAALMLGGNGFWGDLLSLSAEDMDYLSAQVASYKLVAASATRAYPRVSGFPGSSPEIHEKLDPPSASGLVAFFTVTPGEFTHITEPLSLTHTLEIRGADSWARLPDGRLKITVSLEQNDARVVFVMG